MLLPVSVLAVPVFHEVVKSPAERLVEHHKAGIGVTARGAACCPAACRPVFMKRGAGSE